MASDRNNRSNEQQRAVSLLTEAVNILRSPVPATVLDHAPANVRNPSQTAMQSPPTVSNTPAVVSPRSEMDRLFSPYRRDSVGKALGSGCASGSGSRFSWPAPYTYKSWKPKDTWTHQFVCLSNVGTCNVPNRSEKRALKDAGLGEFRVVFKNKRGGHVHVKETLESVFPKIKDAGGFEILRSSGTNRGLEPVDVPATGYTVQQLKETLGQAIGYIRPLQKDLNLYPVFEVSCSP